MRILVVEDDPKVGAFLEQGLSEEGFAIERAADGDAALAKALGTDFDLILLDLMLPKKTGLQVAAELRSRGRQMPILILSARDAPADREQMVAAGADDLLGKPFRFDELIRRIHRLARGH